MKTEFIALTPLGACALLFAGVLAGMAMAQSDIGAALIAVLALLVARENAREPFADGSYVRGWFMWKRTGPTAEGIKSGNVVPLKPGGAA